MLGTKKAMRKVFFFFFFFFFSFFFFFFFFFFFSSVRIALLTSSFKVWITQDFMEKGGVAFSTFME